MTEDLQQLLDRIRHEGVEKAEAEAKAIVEAARKEASDITARAKAEAEATRRGAEKDAKAFAMRADLAQAQEMLRIARRSPLYPRIKRDAAIIYCLHNHISLVDTQIILQDLELPLMGGREQ